MTRVLFVCHGNICRSPMAEFIFKDMVAKQNMAGNFEIASAATSREEIGNPVYPKAAKRLLRAGISCAGKTARQIMASDYKHYDYIICMEQWNLQNLKRLIPHDPEGKLYCLLDFTGCPGDIADPWYTDDFETTFREITRGCRAFLDSLQRNIGR